MHHTSGAEVRKGLVLLCDGISSSRKKISVDVADAWIKISCPYPLLNGARPRRGKATERRSACSPLQLQARDSSCLTPDCDQLRITLKLCKFFHSPQGPKASSSFLSFLETRFVQRS